jgi:hypothetical protein
MAEDSGPAYAAGLQIEGEKNLQPSNLAASFAKLRRLARV